MTGSIVKVGDNKYRIFISNGFKLDGTRDRRSRTITTDLKGRDLKKFLELEKIKLAEEVSRKDPKFDRLAKGTFQAYSIWWLAYKTNISPKTKEGYQRLLDNRLLDLIGHKVLDKITNADMIELMKIIKESPARTKTGRLSINTIKHYHTLLKIMFNDAIKLKIITENPMDNVLVQNPKAKLRDNFYDLEDIDKLLKVLPQAPVKYQLATLIALSTGIRVGELTGLQWKHINYEKLEMKIEQANSYTGETGSFIKDTKNTHSERTVAFPSFLINLFQQHKENEFLKKEALGYKWYYGKSHHNDDFIFTQDNGKMMYVSTPSRWFKKFIAANNLKEITFHGLRHTNTTVLINEGIDIVSISNSLGHAKVSTTMDFYAHHIESVERKMAETFDGLLQSGSQSGTNDHKLRLIK